MKITCCWMYAIGNYGYPPSLENMFKAIEEMAALGFEYIELEGLGEENLRQVIAHTTDLKQHCTNHGLKISNFAVLLPEIISMDPGVQHKAFDLFKQGTETAAALNSPYVWIDSFAPPLKVIEGQFLSNELTFGHQLRVEVPSGFSWERFWDNFVTAVRKCTEIVKASGMTLLVEPRVGEVTSNSEALIRLSEAVADDHFGVILDTAHQHAQKELLPLSVHKLGNLLKYVHVADNDGRDNRHFGIGDGNIDWDAVFTSLKQIGFDGFYAIDLEKLPDLGKKFVENKEILEGYAKRYNL